jgi:uncharacterized membrane protein HdeD (DUF308 family)
MVSYCLLCSTQSWKLPLGLGIAAILLGSLLLLYPSQALLVLIYLVGAVAILIGIVFLFIAWMVFRAGSPFALLPLALGIVVFALGAAAFIYPVVVGAFIAIIIAALCIIAGLGGAFTGGVQKGPLLRRAAISIGGIALAALGVAILLYPELTTTGIMQILGAFILIAGVVSLIGSVILWIRMRSCMTGVREVQDRYQE